MFKFLLQFGNLLDLLRVEILVVYDIQEFLAGSHFCADVLGDSGDQLGVLLSDYLWHFFEEVRNVFGFSRHFLIRQVCVFL